MYYNVHILHTKYSFHPSSQKRRCENWKILDKKNKKNKKEQLSGYGLYLDFLDLLF